MVLKTTYEQLVEVQGAISNVMKGQSGIWDGKAVTMADLGALSQREATLLTRYNSEQGKAIVRNRGRICRD